MHTHDFVKPFARVPLKRNDKFEKYTDQSLNAHKKWLIVNSCYLRTYDFITRNKRMHRVKSTQIRET